MPTKTLKTIAKKTGIDMKSAKTAESIAKKEYPSNWAGIMGATKSILKNKKKSEK